MSGYPTAILHIDGDAFFASCEQAVNPMLKGKPVVTGQERGIVSAASYEAKALGIKRGMTLYEVKRNVPKVIFMPSDYETYSLFSKRMFLIMKRWSGQVEEYGIDEGFMDITGLRRAHHRSYQQIAVAVKQEIQQSLGLTVSVGLAATKVLAKIGSKWQKPDGITCIPNRERMHFLEKTFVQDLWGIGNQTAAYMEKLGIQTADQFANKPIEYVEKYFTKPHQEMWHELNGEQVFLVESAVKQKYVSISKTRTFTPPSTDWSFVYAQVIKNLENACIKARRYNLVAKSMFVFLKTQEFRTKGLELRLSRASSYPTELAPLLEQVFHQLFQYRTPYRATGVTLMHLQEDTQIQSSLFDDPLQLEQMKRVYDAVDAVAQKFGKHTVHLGASLHANQFEQHLGDRGDKAKRKGDLLKGETARKRLGMPVMMVK